MGKRQLFALLFASSLLGRPARAAGPRSEEMGPIQVAQRAIRELRYEDARDELAAALSRGHHSREALIALQALRGEVSAIADGPEVGEAQFRRLLVLMPNHAPPARNTPIFTAPFARARRWVAAHGALRADQRLAPPRAGATMQVAVALLSDPLAMVSGARLFYRARGDEAFTAAAGLALNQTLPALRPGGALDYYLQLVDDADDVVLELGSPDEPFHVELAGEPPPPPPVRAPAAQASAALDLKSAAPEPPRKRTGMRTAGWVVGGLGLAVMSSAIVVDVTGRRQYDSLLSSCAPSCSAATVDQLKRTEAASIGLYAAGGAALATSLVLLVVDLARSARAR